MTEPGDDARLTDAQPASAASALPPTLAEDVLLTLFNPASGTIAGEGTLFYVLGGAVLTELAQRGLADLSGHSILSGVVVEAIGSTPPTDPILLDTWDRLRERPRGVQGLIASTGPRLRSIVIDRLIERGDLGEEKRRMLGFIPMTGLVSGDSSHRDELVRKLRAVLVDGAEPDPRTAALAALLSASGSLSSLYREIPWTGDVADRSTQLEQGDWGAAAAGEAVQRTITAIITASVTAATAAASPSSAS